MVHVRNCVNGLCVRTVSRDCYNKESLRRDGQWSIVIGNFVILEHSTVNITTVGGVRSTFKVCWTVGQQDEQSILHQGHES